MKFKLLMVGMGMLVLTGCKKWMDPDPENMRSVDQMYVDGNFARGFLVTGYTNLPAYYNQTDFATDDAVTNQRSNASLSMATGAWTPQNNPVNFWDQAYSAILYLNLFLENGPQVKWSSDPEIQKLFDIRQRGEALGLRGIYYYNLLQNHAGFSADGELLGVPLITSFQPSTADFNQPRASFSDCLKQIYADLDSADYYLPLEYNNVSNASQIPERFRAFSQLPSNYNRVMGEYSRQLVNGLIVKSFKAKAALLAASPAYQHASNPATWADAANYAAAIVVYKGGANALPANGGTYYANNSELDNLSNGVNPPEIIWRENVITNNGDLEAQNFPPTLFGNGLYNPTQNLVDAFPMANGYPISETASGFNGGNPYANRDPRLTRYIIVNGSTAGVGNQVILTGSASGTDNGIGIRETSTRTGYYMRKRLRMDVNRTPASLLGKNHINPRIRFTELYLAYAEAANEAWGPTGSGSNAFSAYDIIKAIRTRAGVGTDNGHAYLEECKADKDKMRTLIRNERRLELCFEGFRFWDLRRWKANLNEVARGMDVNGAVYTPLTVENRSFQPHMNYGPIPFSEILKYSNLKQNAGW